MKLTLPLLLLASTALAQDAVCSVSKPMSGQRLLRRLALDLRGNAPSATEITAQTGKSEIDEATVDQFLASEEFVGVMRRYHQELLWPNLDSVDIDPLQQKLIPVDVGGGTMVLYSPLRALFVRTITQSFLPCANTPATYDSSGKLVLTPLVVNGQTVGVQEGWVEVEPYWAPGTTVKVCGLDAQAANTAPACDAADTMRSPYMKQFCDQFSAYTAAVNVNLVDESVACDTQFGFLAAGCGCGPNLRLCMTQETAATVRQSLIDQELRIVDNVVRNDSPYTDILLTKNVEMNGPLAHFLQYQSRTSFDVFGEMDPSAPVPAGIAYSNTTWQTVVRTGRHSGVLTTPAYLLRFQSNRGRAHRFYNAFECSDFIPNGPLPSPQDACSQHEDLTKRCGCNACHVVLEPMAGAFGRFAEYGLTPLDEARYPKTYDSVCTNFTDIDQLFRCYRFYEVQPVGEQVPFRGDLLPYVFRTPDQVADLEAGPSSVVEDGIANGKIATCTARRMWTYFMRRPPTADEETNVIPNLANTLTSNNWSVKKLVKAIVTDPAYRRLP